MPVRLVSTKLYIPPARSNTVLRPRLLEQLNEGLRRKVTLISAPAGFGKTTLLATWLASRSSQFPVLSSQTPVPWETQNPAVAWLSLDKGDNDLAHFLAYLIAALQKLAPHIGAEVAGALQSPQPPALEAVLTVLINDIAALPDHRVLILDDYHLVTGASVDAALTFLLEHLPPQLHLVVATREDPRLPLARLRVQGQLTELHADDLRFTPVEATEFLHQTMGLNLSAPDVAALETRTEGWIAGLQLAGLSLQGQRDVASFIRSFTGSHRFVLDYLVEEVLLQQPAHVQSFLLRTSILERLCGPVCDALLDKNQERRTEDSSQRILEYLERSNLFVVPLDEERQWYRYHHLFTEVLQARLMREQPDQARRLHRRACAWHAQNGLLLDAIRHVLAAEDFERAAELVQHAWPLLRQSYHETTLLNWVQALPDALLRARPVLCVYYAFALLATEPETADVYLREAERWLDTAMDASGAQTLVVNEGALRSLPGMISVARAYQAAARRDVSDTVKYAQRALDRLPKDDHLYRGSAAVLLGLAYWTNGDLELAHRTIADGLPSMHKTGNISAAISTQYLLADIRMAQGRLHLASSTSQQALKLATEHGKPAPQGTADVHVLLGELHCEWNELETATQHLLTSRELGEHAALQVAGHRWYVAMARIQVAKGDLDSALDLLDEAERAQTGNPAPDVRPVGALKVRVWIAQGRLTEVFAWARERSLSADDELSYTREYEHIMLARALITLSRNVQDDHALRDATALLDRLRKAAERGRRIGSLIEIRILQALVQRLRRNIPGALALLQQAFTLAEPEGYVRLFVDEGAPMADLLRQAIAHGIAPDYARLLLGAHASGGSGRASQPMSHIKPGSPQSPLVEPLSERELEVLHYIAQGLTNQAIADRLYLSLYTVKAHARNIFGKLDVSNRTQGVARAKALGILPDS